MDIKQIRETYKANTRIRLVRMDDIQAPPAGTEGTVWKVDDIGQLLVIWDTGSTLSVILDSDEIEIIG